MSGVNKCILVGNLGQDPEIRYTQDGKAIANISIATSESWKDKNTGQKQERTEWHRCNAFGKLAEIIGQYLKKGSKVYAEGSIHTRKWQDQQGQDKYSTEIKIRDLQMLDSRSSEEQQQTEVPDKQEPSRNAGQPERSEQKHQSASPNDGQPFENEFDDEIPF